MKPNRDIYVFGHRNPDTDAICSSIAYAALKNQTGGNEHYVPRRLGDVNSETAYVLKRFGHEAPEYLDSVKPTVADLSYDSGERVKKGLSIRKAWDILSRKHEYTLFIVDDDEHLEGVITIGDIAKSIMEVRDDHILSKSKTPFTNIVDTLEAEVLSGEIEGRYAQGKVIVAAANPDQMENYIDPGDTVILGDRYEAQLCAIEMQAGCIVVCLGGEVNDKILRMAQENNCVVLRTQFDTYLASRLMNQSIPIEYFMVKDGIMVFSNSNYIDDIRTTMAKVRHRSFPVVDPEGRLVGMVTRQNLLELQPRRVILIDHNEKSQSADGVEEAEILEIVDHHKVGIVETGKPIMYRAQPVGCSSTIIYMMYNEQGVEIPADIAGLMCSAIISDTLLFRSPTCTPADKKAANELAKIAGIDMNEHAKAMFKAGSDFENKSEKSILYQDFKKFRTGETSFGVGQITAMSGDDLVSIMPRMEKYMQENLEESGLDMIFLMLTDILEESTIFLCIGPDAVEKVEDFHKYPKKDDHSVYMEGVVSRKKQIVPMLMEALV